MTKLGPFSLSSYQPAPARLQPQPLLFAAASDRKHGLSPNMGDTPPPEPPRLPRLIDAASQILDGAWSTLRGIGMNIFSGLSGVASGVVNIFTEDISSGLSSIFKGLFATIVQTPLDAVLSFSGHLGFGAMTALGMTPPRRELDAQERQEVERFFGTSVDLEKVRIQEGPRWIFNLLKAGAFVIGNTIHVSRKLPYKILAHEVMHVLQHQTGGTDYLSESLWAQWTKPGGGYAYHKDVLSGVKFQNLLPEQQGKVVEDLFDIWQSLKNAERIFARYSVRDDGWEELESVKYEFSRSEPPPGYIDITTLVRDVEKFLR